jgi:FtsH-binding integral membrane protein
MEPSAMSYGSPDPSTVRSTATVRGEIDVGLRQYMLRVYNYMATGLAVTGAVSWLGYDSGFYQSIVRTPLFFVLLLAPIGLVFFLSARIYKMSLGAAQLTFWIYSALMGLSLSGIFYRYTGGSIAETFFIAAAMFLGVSLYGYTTRADLTRMGSFMVMGLIGILIASVVNIFIGSAGLNFVISFLCVVIFTGLAAWDTQKIKEQYYAGGGAMAERTALMGALMLYLDFINLFLFLLQFFGQRRD